MTQKNATTCEQRVFDTTCDQRVFQTTRISASERQLIIDIVGRAGDLATRYGVKLDRLNTMMDLEACHGGCCALRLAELLAADDFNLWHDVSGIAAHLDRETRTLIHGFRPRFAVPRS